MITATNNAFALLKVSVVKAAWEPPLSQSQTPREIQDPVLVDYWHGTAANVA
jgi:hypothetical protein